MGHDLKMVAFEASADFIQVILSVAERICTAQSGCSDKPVDIASVQNIQHGSLGAGVSGHPQIGYSCCFDGADESPCQSWLFMDMGVGVRVGQIQPCLPARPYLSSDLSHNRLALLCIEQVDMLASRG